MIRWIGALSLVALGGCSLYIDHRADRREDQAEARHPPVGQFVEVNGRQVHVLVQGSGPDLVLLHGASGNLREYTFDLMGRLTDRYRVFAFDRPGLGYTDRASDSYGGAFNAKAESPQAQAEMLAQAAQVLGADAPIVVGHSFGGAVAMAWGLDHPASGVVSLAGAVMPWPGELGRQYTVLGSGFGGAVVPPFVTAFATDAQVAQAVRAIFAPQPVPEGYLDHIGPDLSLRRSTLRANARQVNSLRPHLVTMSARYPEMTLPVAFVHGDADTIVGLQIHSASAVEILPNATLTVLRGVGHMPHHADPEATVQAIEDVARRARLR